MMAQTELYLLLLAAQLYTELGTPDALADALMSSVLSFLTVGIFGVAIWHFRVVILFYCGKVKAIFLK